MLDHVAKAVLKATRVVSAGSARAGIALPNDACTGKKVVRVMDVLRRLGIAVFGQVPGVVTVAAAVLDPAWLRWRASESVCGPGHSLFSNLTLAVKRLYVTLVNARGVMRQLNRTARERGLDIKVIKPRRGSEHKVVVGGHCKTTVAMHPGDMPTGTLRAIQGQLSHCLGDRWLLG